MGIVPKSPLKGLNRLKTLTGDLFDAYERYRVRRDTEAIIRREALERTITNLFSSQPLDPSMLNEQLFRALAHMGIRRQAPRRSDLDRDVMNMLDVEDQKLSEFTSVRMKCPVLVLDALDELLDQPGNERRSVRRYDPFGNRVSMEYVMLDNMRVAKEQSQLLIWHGRPVHITLNLNEGTMMVHMRVQAFPDYVDAFVRELREVVDVRTKALHQGKIIDAYLRPADLKLYDREDLIYSGRLGEQVDDILRCHRSWFHSEKVKRWGYLLIGRPGTGKTSVGGVLANQRPDGCTYIYAPAATLGSSDQIKRLFEHATKLAPTTLHIDDTDHIAQDRNSGDTSALTAELMEQMDGLTDRGKIFLLLTTNDPSRMEQAIIGRAGRVFNKVHFDGYADCLPGLIVHFADQFDLTVSEALIDAAIDRLGKMANDFTPDEAKNAVERLYLRQANGAPVNEPNLYRSLLETWEAFHGEEMQQSRLSEQSRHNRGGNGNGLAMDAHDTM